nr:thymidylate kinase [uncultured bacterium]
MAQGLFICIEGGDGSGKSTQHELLAARIEQAGRQLLRVNFPRYGQPSAALVERYLRNEFGDATKLDPQLASLPYAIDRLAASPEITAALEQGSMVLAGRFSASNMAHQGAKFADRRERVVFFTWLHDLEQGIMGIPEPDYHFVLHLPADIALQRVQKRDDGTAGGKKVDGLESSLSYQQQAEQTYLDLVDTFPDRFGIIECMDGDRPRTPQEIHEEIWQKLNGLSGYAR